MRKERNETFRFVIKPFLISEEEVNDHHRCAHEVIGEVFLEEPHPYQRFGQNIHVFTPFISRRCAFIYAEALASASPATSCAEGSDENSVMSPSINVG